MIHQKRGGTLCKLRVKREREECVGILIELYTVLIGGVNPALPEMGYMSNLFCLLIGGGQVENT